MLDSDKGSFGGRGAGGRGIMLGPRPRAQARQRILRVLSDEVMPQIATRLQQVDPDAKWHVVETSKGPRLLSARDQEERSRTKKDRTEHG